MTDLDAEERNGVWHLFDPLWANLDTHQFAKRQPLLAHYTSIANIEGILKPAGQYRRRGYAVVAHCPLGYGSD